MDTEQLVARIAELERAVAELRDRPKRDTTMKRTLRCACGGRRILHFTRIQEIGDGRLERLGLVHEKRLFEYPRTGAPLEAYACASCGLVEWHVKDFNGVEIDGKEVVELEPSGDAPADEGPYR